MTSSHVAQSNEGEPAKPPRFTVIIATWNWSSVLPFSIGSVFRQTVPDWELLVVGDGCTDDSETVVATVSQGDPRVRWINLPENFGHQAAPNNEGLRQARGELIAYLGHDDLWLPDHLATLVAALEAGADFAHGPVANISPDGALTRSGTDYRPGSWLPPSGVLHRKTLIDSVGGWSDWRTLPCDPEVDLWGRMHRAGARFADTRRVTVIKFSAASRKNAYKRKSCIEQSVWTGRIETEPALGDELTARIKELPPPPTPKRLAPPKVFSRQWFAGLIRRELLGVAEKPVRKEGQSYQDFFQERRRFKGLGKADQK